MGTIVSDDPEIPPKLIAAHRTMVNQLRGHVARG
jgi:hypothetical protein